MIWSSEDCGKLLLRFLVGGLIILHGIHKVVHGPEEIEAMVAAHGLPGILGWGVYLGEVVGPILVILGVLSRIGGLLILCNMIVAVLLTRGGHVWMLNPAGGWTIELEAFYGLCGLCVALLGAGRYALMRPNARWN